MKDSEILADHQLFHTEFQMDVFITAKHGGTPYGCYKQAAREWFKRYRGAEEQECEVELLKLKIKSLELKNPKTEIGTARKEIRLRQASRGLEIAEFVLSETNRELLHFRNQCVNLKAIVGELTPERRRKLDAEMFEYRALAAAALDLFSLGGLQRSTVEMIQSLPRTMRDRVCVFLQPRNREELINWYMDYSTDHSSLPRLEAHAEDHPVCESCGGVHGERKECHAGAVCGEADGVPGLPSPGGD